MSKKFTVKSAGGAKFVRHLRKLENGGKVVIERTVSDYAKRAPGWVSKGVRKHYTVDRDTVKEAVRSRRGKTSINIAGIPVAGASLEYKSRMLTPTHFNMEPAARPPGVKKYKVSAEIIKGKRAVLHSEAFLARASKENKESKIIPWQRVGDGRLPVHVIKSISVPQMVGGLGEDGKEHVSKAHESIRKEIDQGLTKRFNNHIKQVMK